MSSKSRKNSCMGFLCLILMFGCLILVVFSLFSSQSSSSGELYQTGESPNGVETILVVGVGDDPDERENTYLTDTIMLVMIDKAAQQVHILQIPRDTYVGAITPTGKINAIYNRSEDCEYHGIEGLSRRIYEMFRIPIDHYVLLNMQGFASIVDAIGGVSIDVQEEMSYKGITLYPGVQTLNGEQALVFVRTRNIYANGDLGRVSAQRQFLNAFAAQIKSLSFNDMVRILPVAFSAVETDFTISGMLSLYLSVGSLDLSDLSEDTPNGEAAMIDGQSVYLLYPEETAALLNEKYRPYQEDIPASDLWISEAWYN